MTSTHTSPTSSAEQLTDPRPLLDRAIVTGAAVIDRVRPAQLTHPTPCADMDVRTMLAHLVGGLDRIAALGNGADPFAVSDSFASDDGWVAAWQQAGQRAAEAWRADGVLEGTITLPWIEGTGGEVLATYFSELTVHTWDLATATGQRPEWDGGVVEAALASRQILPAENREALYAEISASQGLNEVSVPFAEAVLVPDDAPAIDRLVAWNGRDPGLSSSSS